MSRTIDERIVQMTFNSKDFEQGAQSAINTLDNLNKSVDAAGFQDSLSLMERAAANFTLAPINDVANGLIVTFNRMEYVIASVIDTVTRRLTNFGINLAKSLTIEPFKASWQKYSDAIASEQTIMSAVAGKISETTGEAYDIDSITDRIGKLQWYTDETSYNISQMTNAIGQFTSAGIDLDKATLAIMGISNACADAGVSTQKAEHAFLGFSRAIGNNNMTMGIWNTFLKTSGITNSERFKQSMIDAGVAVGTLTKISDNLYRTTSKAAKSGIDVTIGNIAETFTKSEWANADVMLNALSSYSDTVDKIYKMTDSGEYDTASEAIQALIQSYKDMGQEVPKSLAAFMRAQEAISLEQAIQSVKDAVSSKWAQTFELIFGNYEEAKVLWTSLANEMWEWFASGGDERNALLEQWHNGVSEFQKALESGKVDKLETQLDQYSDIIKKAYELDPYQSSINRTKTNMSIGQSFLTRDVDSIGKAISEAYDSYKNLNDIRLLFYTGEENDSAEIISLLNERKEALDVLGDSEEDHEKKLEIIEEYYKKIGEAAMKTTKYETYGYLYSDPKILEKQQKYLDFQLKLTDLMKNEKVDKSAISDLLTSENLEYFNEILSEDFSGYKRIGEITGQLDLLGKNAYKNKDEIKALKEEFVDLILKSSEFKRIGALERAKDQIDAFYSAVDNKDSEKLIEAWKNGFKDIGDNDAFYEMPQKIIDIQNAIDKLEETDYFTNKIKDYEERLESATGKEKSRLEAAKSLLEGLSESIKTDSVAKYFEDHKKAMTEYFKDYDNLKDVFADIEKINKDSNLTSQQKAWYLQNQYNLISDIIKEQSNLDELTEKQTELEKELTGYFIDGKTGFDIFLEAIQNGLSNITEVISAIKSGFKEVFPQMSPAELIDLTQSFSDFVDSLTLSEDQLANLQDIVKGLVSPLKVVTTLLGTFWTDFLVPLGERLTPVFESVYKLIQNISKILFKESNNIISNMSPVQNFFANLLDTIQPLINIIQSVIDWVVKLTDEWLNSESKMSENSGFKDNNIFTILLGILQKAFETLEKIITGSSPLFDTLKTLLSDAWDFVSETLGNIFEVITNPLGDSDISAVGLAGIIAAIKTALEAAWGIEGEKFTWDIFGWLFGKANSISEVLHTVGDALYEFSTYVDATFTDSFTNGVKNIGIGILAISGAILILASIKEDDLTKALSAVTWIGAVLAALLKLMDTLKSHAIGSIFTGTGGKGFLGFIGAIFGNVLEGIGQAASFISRAEIAIDITAISVAIIAIANALKMLENVDPTSLTAGVIALIIMMLAIFKLIEAVNSLESSKFDVKKWGKKAHTETGTALKNIGKMILQISAGLLIISFALKNLGGMTPAELYAGVGALTIMLGVIGTFIFLINKYSEVKDPKDFTKLGKAMLQLSVSLVIIAAAINMVKSLTGEELVIALAALGLVLFELFMFIKGMASLNYDPKEGTSLAKIAGSIVIMAVALRIIASALNALSEVKDMKQALDAVTALLIEIFVFMAVMAATGDSTKTGFAGIAAAILIFSAALVVMAGALAVLSLIDGNGIIKALLAIAGTMVIIGGIAQFFSNPAVIAGMIAFSAAFLAIGAAVFLVCSGIAQLVPLLTLLTVQAQSVSEGLSTVFVSVFETILMLIPSFVAAVVNALLDFIDLLIQEALVRLPKFVMDVLHVVYVFLEWLAQGIRDEAGAIGHALGNVVEALMEGLIKAFGGFIDGFFGLDLLSPFFDKMFGDRNAGEGLFGVVVGKGGPAGEDLVNNVADGIKNNSSVVTDAAAEVGAQANDDLYANLLKTPESMDFGAMLDPAGAEFVSGFANSITNHSGEIEPAVAGMSDQIKNGIVGNVFGATEFNPEIGTGTVAEDGGGQTKPETSGGIDVVKSIPALLYGSEEAADEQIASDTARMGENIDTGLATSIDENKQVVIDAATVVGEENAAAFENKEGAEESMKQTLQGLVDISDLETDKSGILAVLRDNCVNIGQMVVSWINEGAGVASPSWKTAETGNFVMRGLLSGIHQMEDSVINSSYGVGASMVKAIQDSANAAESILSNGLNPTIAPILDLSNVRSGVDQIAGLMNSSKTYNAALAVQEAQLSRSSAANNQNGASSATNNINISFNVDQAGGEISDADISRWGRQIADEVNVRLGLKLKGGR